MEADEHQLTSIPGEVPRGPRNLRRLLQVVLTVCVGILAGSVALNSQLMGLLSGVVYLILSFVSSLAGFEVFMVVGFVLAVRAMRRNPTFRRANLGSRKGFVWGRRFALASSVPLAVGCFGLLWYEPSILEIWRSPNHEFVGFFALLGAALVLFCTEIVILGVACAWATWQRVRALVRRPSGSANV